MGIIQTQQRATYVNIYSKGEEPHFFCKEEDVKGYKFGGALTGISVKEPNEVVDFPTVNLEFYDKENKRYILSGGFTNIMTSIINSLAQGVDEKLDFKDLILSLYSKNGYGRIGLFHKGQIVSWKYDIKELIAKTKKVRINGKEQTDREELNLFLMDEIEKINKYLQELNGKGEIVSDGLDFLEEIETENETKPKSEPKVESKEPQKEDDDLPF